MSQELLDVPHLHLTLTIAKELRRFFDRDRNLLKLLLSAAAEAVRQVVALTYGAIQVGLVYTLHTFGRDLVFKPHVHLVLTKGGLDKDGHWIPIDTTPGGRLAAAKLHAMLCFVLWPHALVNIASFLSTSCDLAHPAYTTGYRFHACSSSSPR
jgi:hypothetical protein